LATAWRDGRIKLALIHQHLALRHQLPDVFTNGSYRPLEVVGPNRNEIIAFARVSGREAVIVGCGRLFGRVTDNGRRWPLGSAWNAALAVEGFCDISNVLATGKTLAGTRLPASELFDAIPVALLRARYLPSKRERAPGRTRVIFGEITPVRA
jgi:(1->4)-alpha-D-glucan 1-alpha-D-glucosylmutase